jgi:LAGLIDADG endonuclease
MSSSRRLRAWVEGLGRLQRVSEGSGTTRSLRDTLGCGTIRKAGNDGWYWEVNRLSDITARVLPFFDRFPLVGKRADDYARFRRAVRLLRKGALSDTDYVAVLELREHMNGGGKRRYSAARILRDYTPTSPIVEG